ncbi:MAG: hypothetical protein IJ428_05770 [Clostridia bacterium]|nr:hypothetical protein [Clostridia bacterium]
MVYTYEIATEYNFPNITVYKSFNDGVHNGYRVNSNDGYVMYDKSANNTELDPETMMEVPVIYYYRVMHCPLNYNFANFTWVAVPRDSVDENYIFGAG